MAKKSIELDDEVFFEDLRTKPNAGCIAYLKYLNNLLNDSKCDLQKCTYVEKQTLKRLKEFARFNMCLTVEEFDFYLLVRDYPSIFTLCNDLVHQVLGSIKITIPDLIKIAEKLATTAEKDD